MVSTLHADSRASAAIYANLKHGEAMGIFRTEEEKRVGKRIEEIFRDCPDSIEEKIENFPKYVRRQHLKRFRAKRKANVAALQKSRKR